MKLIKKAQNVRFRNKIAIKLLSYFGVSLFLFSIVIGSIFGYIYIQNTVAMHKKDLEERACKISETLSKVWFENEKSPDRDLSADGKRRTGNPEEDRKMSTNDYQNKMVTGIVNGIEKYFRER